MTARRGSTGAEPPWVDILQELEAAKKRPAHPEVDAKLGMVVEDRSSGFCGDIVKVTAEAVTLRDRKGGHRHFIYKPGGFLLDGRPVSLRRPTRTVTAEPKITNSGSIAAPVAAARVASASRIWVEGKHDAELVEHVWGDDLRELGTVVEPLHGIDDLVAAVAEFAPTATRRVGILVDHLVAGSKEERLARQVAGRGVLVTGHPFVDVWEGVRPSLLGLDAWPTVPLGRPWKEGICAALGADPTTFWPRLRNKVKTFADLRPELVGAVERLIDFVADQSEE